MLILKHELIYHISPLAFHWLSSLQPIQSRAHFSVIWGVYV